MTVYALRQKGVVEPGNCCLSYINHAMGSVWAAVISFRSLVFAIDVAADAAYFGVQSFTGRCSDDKSGKLIWNCQRFFTLDTITVVPKMK